MSARPRDRIFLRDHNRRIEIGAFAEERNLTQAVSFTVELHLDQLPPQNDEDVDGILSYDVIIAAIDRVLSRKRYDLLEFLAEQIASELFVHPQVAVVDLTIEKRDRVDGALGVRISRLRSDINELGAQTQKSSAELLIIGCDDGIDDFPHIGNSTIIAPISHQAADDDLSRRLLALELDQWAWRLGAAYARPVIDTQTESDALIGRGAGFVRGYGKAIFAPSDQQIEFDAIGLSMWLVRHLRPSALRYHKVDNKVQAAVNWMLSNPI